MKSFELLPRFLDFIKKNKIIQKEDKILIACSGGIDSCVLLHLFHCIKEQYSLELMVIHLNHGLRGKESDDDAAFVKEIAEHYQLPYLGEKKPVRQAAFSGKLSLQERARKVRYDFFETALQITGYNKVATAHNYDDQAETVLIHFLRGSSLFGLQGIPNVRCRFIRPLLWCSRKDIEKYVRLRNLNYREDSSNRSSKYLRNRVRLEVIPFLEKKINTNIKKNLFQWGEDFRSLTMMLSSEVEECIGNCVSSARKNKLVLDICKFNNYVILMQRIILQKIGERLLSPHIRFSPRRLDQVLSLIEDEKSGKYLKLSREWFVYRDRSELHFISEEKKGFRYAIEINNKYSFDVNSIKFQSKELQRREAYNKNRKWDEIIDGNNILEPLELRSWQAGDRFVPMGMSEEMKVSNFFINQKIPRSVKNKIPLLVSGGEIIWVCGYRISDKVRTSPSTKHWIGLKCEYTT